MTGASTNGNGIAGKLKGRCEFSSSAGPVTRVAGGTRIGQGKWQEIGTARIALRKFVCKFIY